MSEVIVNPQIRRCDVDYINDFSKEDLALALSCFIREVRRLDGDDFPPNSVREIITMIQMHLQQNRVYWKLFDDVEFSQLRNIVDNTMKERTAQGLGIRKSCEILLLSHEDRMFSCGALGESEPEQLLRTVIYMMGLHLALSPSCAGPPFWT